MTQHEVLTPDIAALVSLLARCEVAFHDIIDDLEPAPSMTPVTSATGRARCMIEAIEAAEVPPGGAVAPPRPPHGEHERAKDAGDEAATVRELDTLRLDVAAEIARLRHRIAKVEGHARSWPEDRRLVP